MAAGRRDQRIKFQRESATGDGQGGLVAGWTDVGSVTMAELVAMSGREAPIAGTMQPRTSYKVTIPNRRDLDAGMRILWVSNGGAVLNIRDMGDPGPRAIERTLVAELGGTEHA